MLFATHFISDIFLSEIGYLSAGLYFVRNYMIVEYHEKWVI